MSGLDCKRLLRCLTIVSLFIGLVGCTTQGGITRAHDSVSEPFALADSPALSVERLPDEVIVARTETSPHGQRAAELLFRAMSLLGTPYRYGGTQPDHGFDCSGFMGFLYRDVLGFELPRTAAAQARFDAPDIPLDALEPGDLVFFNIRGKHISHVGIYAGNGEFVHAPSTGGRVRIDQLSNRYWAPRAVSAKRPLAMIPEPLLLDPRDLPTQNFSPAP